MASSPSTASPPISATDPSFKLPPALVDFVVRRRILLSILLFGAMIGEDVAFGHKPRDLFDYHDAISMLGVGLIVGGLALRSWATGILHKNSELATTGPYRLIRNPLYVGSFAMMFGFCALLGDLTNVAFVVGPVFLMYVLKVQQEERYLSTHFPAPWVEYSRQTPRFLPRLRRVSLAADWRFSQWLDSREYQALGTTLLAFVALWAWRTL
jgi:protein-S-isoprenylcysteine O-methyltransferase Ste14